MPSLNALREFKDSFGDIGREKAELNARDLPYNDLELPENEPDIPQTSLDEGLPPEITDTEAPFSFDMPETTDTLPEPDEGTGDLDFGAFLDTVPDDFGDSADSGAIDTDKTEDDFTSPPDLLAGFADELEASSPDFSAEETETTGDFDEQQSTEDFGDFDLGSLEGFEADQSPESETADFGNEPAETAEEPLDGFDGELQAADQDIETLEPGTLNEAEGRSSQSTLNEAEGRSFQSTDLGEEILDLGGDSLDLGGESPHPGSDTFDTGSESFGLGEDTFDAGGDSLGLGEDAFDTGVESFDLGEDVFDAGGENLDLGEDTFDTGGESLDLGGDTFDAGGDNLDLGEDAFDTGGDNLDLGEDAFDAGAENLDLGGDSFDTGGENLDLGGDSFDTGGDSLDLGGDSFDAGSEDLDLGEDVLEAVDESLDMPEDISGEDSDILDLDKADLDLGGEEPAADSFDAFSPGGEISSLDFTEDTGVSADGAFNMPEGQSFQGTGDSDFSLPGIDDLFEDTPPDRARKKTATARKSGESAEEVEEIRLSDEELTRLTKTLAGYPLNLRIACEELIAEQAVAPNLMSRLIKLLVKGAPARETAALAGKILDRTITIPRGFEKSTGEAMEAERSSFAYIFFHSFLPVFRLFLMIAVVAASLSFLIYKFVYTPIHAENIYKTGYQRIFAGEYQRANERFNEAFGLHRKKIWFYRYAEAFRDERQYIFAEQKYDELLRYYQRDKKGVLDYASMETYYLNNYDKADRLLRRELLDYSPDDLEGLLALGDNSLAWGELDRSKYDDARFAYARLLDKYGWKDPIVERMMKYFIRTDNLKEVLPLHTYFTSKKSRKISADSLAELGGYLLDKQLEQQRGVPNEYIENITGVRDILLRAVGSDPSLPEPHYHLARYYNNLGNSYEERITLETALRAFDAARRETVLRLNYHIDTLGRYANILIGSREFFPAEESLVKGINLYEDALSRRLITRNPEHGKLYASLGDLEYFAKSGNWERALDYYHSSELNGWAPPEIQYRMGSAYYQLENWRSALEYLFAASADLPLSRRLLYALGNASYKRNDFFAAQGYYNRLVDILESERSRLPVLLPNDRPDFLDIAERLMMARNNAGAAYEALADQTGNQSYRSRAMAMYAESSRAWDSLTRNPQTMIRSGSIPLPQLNSRNALYPVPNYQPQIFVRIDRDVLEPSEWEQLVPVIGF